MASIYLNRKDGKIVSFKFKAFLGRDENGRQIVKCTTWTADCSLSEKRLLQLAKKESAIWEKRISKEVEEERRLFQANVITFSLFVEKVWFVAQVKEKEIRETTQVFYRYLMDKMCEYFRNKKLKDITSKQIELYFDYLKKSGKTLSQKTLRHHYTTLHSIFEYAVKKNYILNSPLNKVDAPKLAKKKVDALSKSDVLIFMKELQNLSLMHRTIYTLLLTTGLRRGECFGLQWKDIDFKNHLLHVERNVTYTSKSGVCVGLPKTETGIRTVPLTNEMVSLLEEYKKESGIAVKGSMFLFHSAKSHYQPQEPTHLTKHLKRFMKRINLPDMSPHDLRHTCASLLIQGGVDVRSVQDVLGHADASTTLNFYVKSDIEKIKDSTQKVFSFS